MTEAYIILSGSIPKHTTELSNRAQDTATKLLSIYFTTHKDDQAVEELLLHLTIEVMGHISLNLWTLHKAKVTHFQCDPEYDVEGHAIKMAIAFLKDKLEHRLASTTSKKAPTLPELEPIVLFVLNSIKPHYEGTALKGLHDCMRQSWSIRFKSYTPPANPPLYWPPTDWFALWMSDGGRKAYIAEARNFDATGWFKENGTQLEILKRVSILESPVVRDVSCFTLVYGNGITAELPPGKKNGTFCKVCGQDVNKGHGLRA